MSLKLYDLCGKNQALRFSPHCWKTKMALMHKSLEFETIPTPFTAIASIGEDISSVPVLVTDGKLIRDSFDIALFLDETYPDRPPLFGHPGVVSATRFIEGWAATVIHPIIFRMIAKDIHDVLDEDNQRFFRESREPGIGMSLGEFQQGVDALADQLSAAFAPLRRALKHQDFIGGSGPLFSDYIALGPLMWLSTIHGSVPLAPDDTVYLWYQRCLNLFNGYAASAEKAA